MLGATFGPKTRKQDIRHKLEMQNAKLRQEMHVKYKSCNADSKTFQSADTEAEKLLKRKYPAKQTHYNQIPIFPYGYRNPADPADKSKKDPPSWAAANLHNNYLPSNPTNQELDNLYMQLSEHATQMSSISIPTEENEGRPSQKVPVTSPSPPDVVLSPTPPPCSTSKPKEFKKEKKKPKPPPDSKTHSKQPKVAGKGKGKQKEEKKEKRRGQDTYHIIRIFQRRTGKYLELLRADSDGYIIGYRILSTLDDFLTAYWNLFSDFSYLKEYLTFLEIKIMHYGSGYSIVHRTFFGDGTLDIIMDTFLNNLYRHPENATTDEGSLFFHILCLVFGESPRLELLRKFTFRHREVPHQLCYHQRQYQLGPVLNYVVNNWRNMCATTLYLLVAFLEMVIASEILSCRPHPSLAGKPQRVFDELFDEFEENRKRAHLRCVSLMRSDTEKDLHTVLKLDRDIDHNGNHVRYGEMALYQLLNEHLYLIKHDEELVRSVILRMGNFRKLTSLSHKDDDDDDDADGTIDMSNVRVDDSVYMFWEQFDQLDLYIKAKMKHGLSFKMDEGMKFLASAIPLLNEHDFEGSDFDLYHEVVARCNRFEDLQSTKHPREAADSVWADWESKNGVQHVLHILSFIGAHKPPPPKPKASTSRSRAPPVL